MEYTQLLSIENSANIIIYGAGTFGRIIYHLLLKNLNIKIIAWSDQQYKKINDAPIEIINPKIIKNYSYDFIVLTIDNDYKIKKITQNLIEIGINEGKIISLSKKEIFNIIEDEINYILINDNFARKCLIRRLINDDIDYDGLKPEIYKLFISGARIRYWNNSVEQRHWFMGNHSDIAYLRLAKCACTSIISTLINEEPGTSLHDFAEKKYKIIGNIPQNDYIFKFTYVRNPFERLVSCYVDKIENKEKGNPFKKYNYCMGILNEIQNFDEFVKCIVKIPVSWADRHFKSQYSYIYENGEKLVDYIGKVEDLTESYKLIQEKYDLKKIGNMNKSKKKDWKVYYTKETAKLVYEYYKKDILTFGYEQVYYELLEYLNKSTN
ncbi:MAG: sulfotransferase family 2 domain-containing protein [Lachnospiraceae bacterium]|nr:sulfotransferase family 2 domain-containing protein [Lachnospiraceae bacterium]